MTSFFILAVCLLIFWALWWLLLIKRNNAVYEYRRSLIREIARVGQQEIDHGTISSGHYLKRWLWFDSVSYDQMMYQFWKPLDSFYPDREKWLSERKVTDQ